MLCTRDIGAERQFRNVLGTYRVAFTLQYRYFTSVARFSQLLQVFDGRSKTRNILPQQKIAKSCGRAPCHTGQLPSQCFLRGKLLLRVVPCNITFSFY